MVAGFPAKYIQGAGVLSQISNYLPKVIKKPILIGDEVVLSLVQEKITKALLQQNKEVAVYKFGGESSEKEVNQIRGVVAKANGDCIMAVGGGKTLDTARAVAYYQGLPVVIIPTIAATDSPVSSLAGIYSEDHKHQYTIRTKRNPDVVIVDTEVIVNAPIRFFISGIGDAIATKFEAEASFQAEAKNIHGGKATLTSLALADLAFKIIMEHGREAKEEVLRKKVTPQVEKVVEADVLLSGLGFESGGLAAAHGLHHGLTILPESKKTLHGEKVAYTTLVQLKMEQVMGLRENDDILMQLHNFYQDIGLPITLSQLGISGSFKEKSEKIRLVAKKACEEGGYIHNMPFDVSEGLVCKAVFMLEDMWGET